MIVVLVASSAKLTFFREPIVSRFQFIAKKPNLSFDCASAIGQVGTLEAPH